MKTRFKVVSVVLGVLGIIAITTVKDGTTDTDDGRDYERHYDDNDDKGEESGTIVSLHIAMLQYFAVIVQTHVSALRHVTFPTWLRQSHGERLA